MNLYATEIQAVDPLDGEIKTYKGPDVPGISPADAARYCQENGLGYCNVKAGEIIETDYKTALN